MKLVLWLAISMISSSVSADHFKPEWTASCAYNGSNFELILKSTSGDATNDDMQISIKTTEKVVKTLKLPEVRISGSSGHSFRCEPASRFGIVRPPISV